MASEDDRQELRAKVSNLVGTQFGGDYQRAFRHYDGNQDGKINKEELKALLHDAGVGNAFTRAAWASGISGELDTDGDRCISWAEFEPSLTGGI